MITFTCPFTVSRKSSSPSTVSSNQVKLLLLITKLDFRLQGIIWRRVSIGGPKGFGRAAVRGGSEGLRSLGGKGGRQEVGGYKEVSA